MLAGKLIEVRTPNWDPLFGRGSGVVGRRTQDAFSTPSVLFSVSEVSPFCSHCRIILELLIIELFSI